MEEIDKTRYLLNKNHLAKKADLRLHLQPRQEESTLRLESRRTIVFVASSGPRFAHDSIAQHPSRRGLMLVAVFDFKPASHPAHAVIRCLYPGYSTAEMVRYDPRRKSVAALPE